MSEHKMNTKFVGHHISSGGFIFYKDKHTGEIYTLLLRNKKGEWWIPKGHIEPGEDQVSAAFREIEEEVGLNKTQLTYIGLCKLYEFSFLDDEGQPNTKEIYMNVFAASEKYKPVVEANTSADDADWFKYADALAKISFSKEELIKAEKMFQDHLNTDKTGS
jgi:ADP-ribose pyrophosphatase YjhB (NUDIX family)